MRGKWGWIGQLGLLLIFVAGCRTSQPDLKPLPQPEVLNPPPANIRYDSYPKQAFNVDDPFKRAGSLASGGGPAGMGGMSNSVMPTRGGMGGPGFGGPVR
jgi:hypothetical protein